jgi:N-methylhydantoinase A
MQELGIPRGVVPSNPGALSAVGMLATDFRHDHARTYVRELEQLDLAEVNAIFSALDDSAVRDLETEGVNRDRISLMRSVDTRYVGQEYHINLPIGVTGRETEISVQLGAEPLKDSDRELIARRFNEAHEKLYGYCTPETPVQVVNLRVAGVGLIAKPRFPVYEGGSADAGAAIKTRRKVFFKEAGRFVDTPIYDVLRLKPGNRIDGPAIVEDPNSTILVLPQQTASIDQFRNVFIEE